jgi:hypothetical protein
MKKPAFSAIAVVVFLMSSAAAMGAGMSKDDYRASKDRIAADYKNAKATCGSYAGNTKDVCVADADGKNSVAKAQLEATYEPTLKNRYDVSIATAEARYAVAREKCNTLAGNGKDVCIKQAEADQVAAKSDAKVWLNGAGANQTASNNRRDADYAVAKEKCSAFSGDAKDNCLRDAKARFGE